MPVYIDTSALVPVFVQEEASHQVISVLRSFNDIVILSNLARIEFSATLCVKYRQSLLTEADLVAAMAVFDAHTAKIFTEYDIRKEDIAAADIYARTPALALRAPDAIHIAAAHHLGARLFTLDTGMSKAALGLAHEIVKLD